MATQPVASPRSRSPLAPPVASKAWVAIPLAVVIGVLAVLGPLGWALALAALALTSLTVVGRRLVEVYPAILGALLVGYVFLDRGFSHLGVGQIYLGEVVLVLGLAASLMVLPRLRFGAVEVLLVVFMVWGALRTIPYVGTYGVDALRDGVTWGYAAFALIVTWLLRPEHVLRVVNGYRRLVWPIVLWYPIAITVVATIGDRLPMLPGSNVAILAIKGGDAAVNLTGVAAFVLTGLYAWGGVRTAVQEVALWIAWLVPTGIAAALNRGAMAAASMAAVSALFVRSSSRWLRLVVVGLLIVVGLAVVNPQIDVRGTRKLSFDQLVSNALSVLGGSGGTVNDATKEWRLAWWNKIIGYTIGGADFWTGKGYGVNLANDDGFQVLSDRSLRAPHSVHFEILARSGVPGLVLWVSVLIAWIVCMLRAGLRAARAGQRYLLAVIGWVVAYWLAALVNGSVDVYIGGPQGGILFWSLFGFGLLLARLTTESFAQRWMPTPRGGGSAVVARSDLPA